MTSSQRNRRNRAKGQEYERRMCKTMESALPGTSWKRCIQARGARSDGADIEGTTPLGELLPLWLELHCGTKPAKVKLEQAIRDAQTGWHPIAIVHRPGTNYSSDTAHMRLGDLLELSGIDGDDYLDAESLDTAVSTPVSALLHLLSRWYGRVRL